MRTAQKTALTLLIAIVVTAVFAAFAYTGLFRVFETGFFSERVELDQKSRLQDSSSFVETWLDDTSARFDAISRERVFQSVFSLTQRDTEIQGRSSTIDSLRERLDGFEGLRIIDYEDRIQYSSYAGDISSQTTGERRLYRNWSQIAESFDLPPIDEGASVQFDEETQRFIFLTPVEDRAFASRGWMLVWMSTKGLEDSLASEGFISPGSQVSLVEALGLVLDIREEQFALVKGAIREIWSLENLDSFALLAESGADRFWLVTLVTQNGVNIGKLVPGQILGFTPSIQILLVASVFAASSLLIFLLLNIRQDRTLVLQGRIKKLQVNLLRDWLENHEEKKITQCRFRSAS